MLNGELYDAGDPQLVRERQTANELTHRYNETSPSEDEQRAELFGSVGENTHVEPPFRCDYGTQIHVGDDFYANFDCVILDVCRVGRCRDRGRAIQRRRPGEPRDGRRGTVVNESSSE